MSAAIESPSASEAVTLKLIKPFSGPAAVAGAITTGGGSTLTTVIWVVAEPIRMRSLPLRISENIASFLR